MKIRKKKNTPILPAKIVKRTKIKETTVIIKLKNKITGITNNNTDKINKFYLFGFFSILSLKSGNKIDRYLLKMEY